MFLFLRLNEIKEVSDKIVFIGFFLELFDLSFNFDIKIYEDVLKFLIFILIYLWLDNCKIDVLDF